MNIIPIVLTIHVLIVIALIGLVLLQRSEGGALGIGGGGGGFMSGRGAANVLTRSTSIAAALFFATSLGLAIFADKSETETEIFNEVTGADVTEDGDNGTSARDFDGIFSGEGADTPEEEAATVDPLSTIGTTDNQEETPSDDTPTETPAQTEEPPASEDDDADSDEDDPR